MPTGSNIFEEAKVYQGIKKKLYEVMIDEHWKSKDRLPPIKDLAKQLGAGQKNTQRAIQDLVKEGLLISKPKLGTFVSNRFESQKQQVLGITERQMAQPPLHPLSKKRIEMVINKASAEIEPFYQKAVNAFRTQLPTETQMILEKVDVVGTREVVIHPALDALVLVNPAFETHPTDKLPPVVIFICTSEDYLPRLDFETDVVTVDDLQGAFLAGQYLRKMGWEDVCFIGTRDFFHHDQMGPTTLRRYKGFTAGLQKEIPKNWQLKSDGDTRACGAQMVRQWAQLNPSPSAIFTNTDDIALGFMYGAYALGLTPGKDYHIIGFDGQQTKPDSQLGVLTTIEVPMAEMAIETVNIIAERLKRPEQRTRRLHLRCSLIEGTTVRPRQG